MQKWGNSGLRLGLVGPVHILNTECGAERCGRTTLRNTPRHSGTFRSIPQEHAKQPESFVLVRSGAESCRELRSVARTNRDMANLCMSVRRVNGPLGHGRSDHRARGARAPPPPPVSGLHFLKRSSQREIYTNSMV